MNDFLLAVYLWVLTDRGQNIMAAIAGSLVAVLLEWEGFGSNVRRFLAGATAAMYLGPVGVPFFQWVFSGINVPVTAAPTFGTFMMGVSSIVVLEVFTRTLKYWVRKPKVAEQ